MTISLILLVAIAVTSFLISRSALSRGGFESAAYDTLLDDGQFELRHYADLDLVSTPMLNRSSPSSDKKETRDTGELDEETLFELNSGTKVKLLERRDGYVRIVWNNIPAFVEEDLVGEDA